MQSANDNVASDAIWSFVYGLMRAMEAWDAPDGLRPIAEVRLRDGDAFRPAHVRVISP